MLTDFTDNSTIIIIGLLIYFVIGKLTFTNLRLFIYYNIMDDTLDGKAINDISSRVYKMRNVDKDHKTLHITLAYIWPLTMISYVFSSIIEEILSIANVQFKKGK